MHKSEFTEECHAKLASLETQPNTVDCVLSCVDEQTTATNVPAPFPHPRNEVANFGNEIGSNKSEPLG